MTRKNRREDIPEVIEQEIRMECQADLDELEKLGLISRGEVVSVEATPVSVESRVEFDVVIEQDIITVMPANRIAISLVLGPPPKPRWYWYLLPWKWRAIVRWRRFKAL